MIKGCKSSTSLIILICIGEFQVIGYLNRIKYRKKIEVASNTPRMLLKDLFSKRHAIVSFRIFNRFLVRVLALTRCIKYYCLFIRGM